MEKNDSAIKLLAGLAAAALIASAFIFRYAITPASTNSGAAWVYKLDRWTGQVYAIRNAEELPVQPKG